MARRNTYSRRRQQAKRRSTSRSANLYRGADDVYLTENSIAVRRMSIEKGRGGKARMKDNTTYVPKTQSNLRTAKRKYGYLRFGRD